MSFSLIDSDDIMSSKGISHSNYYWDAVAPPPLGAKALQAVHNFTLISERILPVKLICIFFYFRYSYN